MKNYRNSKFDERQRNSIRKKLVVVGDGECGKTCLLTVFCKDEFPEVHIPTVFETDITDIEVDGKLVELSLWDTAGQEDYDRLRPLSYPDTDVVLICFSVSNPVSLSNISEKWFPEVKHFCPNVPILLIGTKKDLRQDALVIDQILYDEKNKQKTTTTTTTVRPETGSQLAQTMKAFAFLECSAKTKEGVSDVLLTAARASLATKEHHNNCGSRSKCRLL